MIWKRNKSKQIPRSIGVIGSKSGCGVTHTALMLANYLSAVEKYSVNYVELCNKSQIYNLVFENACYKGEEVCYSYLGVDYYPDATERLTKRLLMEQSAITVIDFGIHSNNTFELLDKCERILAIGSVMPWCLESFQMLISEIQSNYIDMHKVKACVRSTEPLGRFSQLSNHRISLIHSPEGVNPFALRQSDFESILRLLV